MRDAVKSGNIEDLKGCLDSGCDINSVDPVRWGARRLLVLGHTVYLSRLVQVLQIMEMAWGPFSADK